MASIARELGWGDLLLFNALCEQLGMATPAPVVRGLALRDAAHTLFQPKAVKLLSLDDHQVEAVITDWSIRAHSGDGAYGMQPGLERFDYQLLQEVRAATLPLLDDLVTSLQPEFDQIAAAFVEGVQRFGFTGATTPGDVLDMADEAASAAFRATRDAWVAADPIVNFRQTVSRIFGVSPTAAEQSVTLAGEGDDFNLVDYSVCFAEGDNWSEDGESYIEQNLRGGIDWYVLARGGLRLNTPSECRQKLVERRAWVNEENVDATSLVPVAPGAEYPVTVDDEGEF